MVNNLPAMQETRVWFLCWEDPLKKGMAIHSTILAWRIPWTEKPGGLQFVGLQRVTHNWVTNTWFRSQGERLEEPRGQSSRWNRGLESGKLSRVQRTDPDLQWEKITAKEQGHQENPEQELVSERHDGLEYIYFKSEKQWKCKMPVKVLKVWRLQKENKIPINSPLKHSKSYVSSQVYHRPL